LPQSIDEERVYKKVNWFNITKAYSPGNKLPNHLAPVRTHKRAFFLILSRITIDGSCLLLKTLNVLLPNLQSGEKSEGS
jgi:hypothetical protein